MDPDTKAVLLELCQLCQGALENASQARLTALRVHEALYKRSSPRLSRCLSITLGGIAGLEDLRRELQGLIAGKLRKSH